MATKKMMGCLFERNRYPGGATAKVATPKNRSELMALLGGPSKVHIRVGVYDRGTNSPSVDVIANAGCMAGTSRPGRVYACSHSRPRRRVQRLGAVQGGRARELGGCRLLRGLLRGMVTERVAVGVARPPLLAKSNLGLVAWFTNTHVIVRHA